MRFNSFPATLIAAALAATQVVRGTAIQRGALTKRALPFATNDSPGIIYDPSKATGGGGLLSPLDSPTAQPAVLEYNGCSFDYAPVMSGPNPIADIYVQFKENDIAQTWVGDCGFGAAMQALRSVNPTGLVGDLKVLSLAGIQGAASTAMSLNLYHPTSGKRVQVLFDDKLPLNTACTQLTPSFQMRTTNGKTNALVPLYEKAVAKMVDEFPEFHSSEATNNGWTGFAGLSGIESGVVLSMFTGKKYFQIIRKQPGYDANFAQGVLNCLNFDQPCVFGMLHPDPTEAGWLVNSDAVTNLVVGEHSYTFHDVDLGQDTTLLFSHWIALVKDRSPNNITPTTPNNKPNKVSFIVYNPWGANPSSLDSPTTTDGGEIRISLRAAYAMFRRLHSLQ